MIKETVFKSFETPSELEKLLAERIAKQLQEAVDSKGQASLIVSGGSTPKALFSLLSKKRIDWSEVYITLADERWVDSSDSASNEAMVKAHLLVNSAKCAKFQGLKNMFSTPFDGVDMAIEKLAHMPKPFDVVILGMGTDGHTCSWFPCSAELEHALSTNKLCAGVTPTSAPNSRITLSKTAILNSKQIYVHLVGEQKLSVYRQALALDDQSKMPICAVLGQHKTPVDVYWSA